VEYKPANPGHGLEAYVRYCFVVIVLDRRWRLQI